MFIPGYDGNPVSSITLPLYNQHRFLQAPFNNLLECSNFEGHQPRITSFLVHQNIYTYTPQLIINRPSSWLMAWSFVVDFIIRKPPFLFKCIEKDPPIFFQWNLSVAISRFVALSVFCHFVQSNVSRFHGICPSIHADVQRPGCVLGSYGMPLCECSDTCLVPHLFRLNRWWIDGSYVCLHRGLLYRYLCARMSHEYTSIYIYIVKC